MSDEQQFQSQESSEIESSGEQQREAQVNEQQIEALQEKAENGTLTKAEKKMLKELDIKVDGKTYKEKLPFEIPDDPESIEYMRRQLQMSKAASKRMQEHSQLQKDVGQFLEMLRKNPRKALSDPSIGVDVKELAKAVIEEEIANSQKSPEQLEKERLENELKELKEKYEKDKESAKAKEFERLQQEQTERYDMLMTQALDKSDLPKSPYVVKKMADYLLLALDNDIDATPEDVLPLVRDEIYGDLKEMFAVMPEDVIEKVIGKDVLNKVRKKNLAKAKQAPPVPLKSAVKDVGASKAEAKQEDKQKMTFKEFFGV